jgi:ABC-2 type transport system ATP-binding protein
MKQMLNICVVKTENLSKLYGEIAAVDDLNMEIKRGDVFGFLGPNGSGKTTTISMLLGLIRPSSGRILLFGKEFSPLALARVGAVMDKSGFYARLSGLDNLLIFGAVHKRPDRKRVMEVLASVGLAERARSRYQTYSLGMKQRLAIALAMLDDPDFFIFDEPTNGMDPEGIAEIRGLIIKLASQGKTVFLASHLLAEVEQVCSRVAILSRGAVIKQGSLPTLLTNDGQTELELTVSNPTQTVAALFAAGFDAGAENNRVTVMAHAGRVEEIGALLAAQGIFPSEIKQIRSTLEGIFLRATAEHKSLEAKKKSYLP